MNPAAFIISTPEHMRILANIASSNVSIVELIQMAVGILFGIGVWSFLYSQLRLSIRDQGGLDQVRDSCGSSEKVDLIRLKDIMHDKSITSSLIYERIKTIVDMFHSAGNDTTAQPKLQDLHRMSEQSMFSRSGATLLRMMTNVLLIVGICGTLWGVHSALGISETHFEINSLSYALGPSKYAVLGTIILLVCRSIFEARVERHICDMDSFTMSRLLPYLQGRVTEQSSLSSLTASIQTFNELQQNCNNMVNSIKGVLDTLSRPSPAFQKMKRELEDMLSSLRAEEIKHQAAEEEEQQQAYTAAELLSKLRTSLDNITETQAGISKEWMPLRENLSGIHTNVKLVADASASIENLIEHVNTVSQQLKDAEGYHQDVTMLRQELSSAAYQVSDEIQISMDALKLLDTRAEQVQLQVNAMESTQQELQQVVADTEAHVTEFANRANLFAENIETLGQRISESVSAIDSATLAVENASQDGIRHLDSIRSRVDSFISNAKHSSTRRNRKNLK